MEIKIKCIFKLDKICIISFYLNFIFEMIFLLKLDICINYCNIQTYFIILQYSINDNYYHYYFILQQVQITFYIGLSRRR
jgi:hypothetical protein